MYKLFLVIQNHQNNSSCAVHYLSNVWVRSLWPGGNVNLPDPNDSTLRCLHRFDNVICTAVFQVRLYLLEANLPFTPGAPVMSCVMY